MTRLTNYPLLCLLFIPLLSCVTAIDSVLDFDLDGVADEDDCAPADPSIYPGAGDEYGDDIDSNCDGVDGNSVDQDDDGYSNAIDCDDRNEHVYPGAEDLPGDELDSNCDGIDGVAVDLDGDRYSSAVDCDDEDPSVYPGADEIADNGIDDDCDNEIDEGSSGGDDDDAASCGDGIVQGDEECDDGNLQPFDGCLSCLAEIDADGDGWYEGQDCDDSNSSVSPGAPELCDPEDRDCDGDPFQGATDTSNWYLDLDGDSYGDPGASLQACAGAGFVQDNTDCDDGNSTVYPDAAEVCDQLDNDCDGLVDDDDTNLDSSTALRWYVDADQDGVGSADVSIDACLPPSGYQLDDLDCDDGNAAINPSQHEICDGIDNNCDTLIDDADPALLPSTTSIWYQDQDGDGFGAPLGAAFACSQPSGYIGNSEDCDDADQNTNPTATELCNGLDDDCDGLTDPEGTAGGTTYYLDADEDGFGRPSMSVSSCSQPTSYVTNNQDCDDLDSNIFPQTQDNVCDGLDSDCSGGRAPQELDDDGDGFIGCSPLTGRPSASVQGGGDCDDGPLANWHNGTTDGPDIHPGATEVCDGVDNDCDEVVDEGCYG